MSDYDGREPLPPVRAFDAERGALRSRFGAAPLSVISIDANAQRERTLREYVGDAGQLRGSASVFSPVLATFMIGAYSNPGEVILDPFAGGGTRAVMAAELGRRYLGVELRPEEAQRVNTRLAELDLGHLAHVHVGDATAFAWREHVEPDTAAAVLTSPPFWALERYNGGPADLSEAPSYEQFRDALAAVIRQLTPVLAHDAFAAWVVGRLAHPESNELLDLPGDVNQLHRSHSFRVQDRVTVLRASAPNCSGFERSRRTYRIDESIIVCRYLPDEAADR
jgi:DNA methylase